MDRTMRRAVLDWIRDDAPLTVKMALMPEHVTALVDRLTALRAEPARGAEEMRERAATVCDDEARDQGHCHDAHRESGANEFADAAEGAQEVALTLAAAIRALPLPQGNEGGGE